MFICECELCIYNEEFKCTLAEIEISSTGDCENCLLSTIEDGVLKIAKKKTRANFELRLKHLEEAKKYYHGK